MLQLERASTKARRQLLIYAVLPLAYVISGRLGLLLAVPPGYATAVFLPAGISVAAIFIAGATTLPGTLLGSFLLNIWIGYSIAHQLDVTRVAVALVIAFASMAQAAVGGTLLRKVVGDPARLDNPRDLLLFLLLAPVFCVTSATLSLAGMWAIGAIELADVPINWMTWWVGDTLGVLVVLPLMLVLAGQPQARWRSRASFIAIPMILCFALFVAIFVRVSSWENEQSLLEFRMRSQQLADAMKASLEDQVVFLEQLSSVFISRRLVVTRPDFYDLVQKLLQRFPTIQAVEWAPKVESGEREAFQEAQQADLPGFSVRERAPSGELRPAGERSYFYPVTYVEPLGGNEPAVGFDLASDAVRRTAIESAITSGNVTATAPIRLVQERGEQAGILLIQAVSSGPTGPGIVLVALRMETFTTTLAGPFASILGVRLVDAAGSRPLFENLPGPMHPAYETTFNFGSRRYVVQTMPSAAYLLQHRGWQSWAVLAAGALGTGLLGALLMLGTGHAYRFEKLADRLRESEARKTAVLDSALDAVIAMDQDGRIVDFNPAAEQLFGHHRDEMLGKMVADTIIPDRLREAHRRGLRHFLETGEGPVLGRRIEMPALRADGSEFASELAISTTLFENRQVMFTAYLRDITERKQAEERSKTLTRELQHRSNNLLAVIQAIAHRSLSGTSLEQARTAFESRLQALARTHRQLTTSNWTGVSLSDIVRSELDPFAARTRIEGADIILGPRDAQNFSLALHELATNAVKHGALSSPAGQLSISWTVSGSDKNGVLNFRWRERGGPPAQSPKHHGFGTSLLKATFRDVRFEYAPEGLNCEVNVPLGSAELRPAMPAGEPPR